MGRALRVRVHYTVFNFLNFFCDTLRLVAASDDRWLHELKVGVDAAELGVHLGAVTPHNHAKPTDARRRHPRVVTPLALDGIVAARAGDVTESELGSPEADEVLLRPAAILLDRERLSGLDVLPCLALGQAVHGRRRRCRRTP